MIFASSETSSSLTCPFPLPIFRFKQSVAVAYEFSHPLEGLLVNGLPLFVALWFANLHVAQLCLFLAIRITGESSILVVVEESAFDLSFAVRDD